MQTPDLELKKLIYLYLINYSKSEPELALHAVNTFDKDTRNPNPLVRALAIRTMGCIRIDSITEYLCEPLHRCLKDQDPYVKKTAVLGVAKMYDINPSLVEEEGFLDDLRQLLGDGNPMVVANCVATLTEIQMMHPEQKIFSIDNDTRMKLLSALTQSNEWGQVNILDAFGVFYNPASAPEAEEMAERVALHLVHDNSAVVISAAKVILKMLPFIEKSETIQKLYKRLAPPLVSLLSGPPEIRYVALRNLNVIIQRLPSLLTQDIKTFFCKYNDPVYVKLEKLEIMMLLVNEQNVGNVLNELKEYASEVDVDFVRKAVRAMGRCAILLPDAANVCVDALVQLIETSQVNYVIQEAIIVIKDIFRKYPNKYESIIVKLCDKLQSLDEPEAKAAMIWIIGEYSDRIEGADQILDSFFLENFQDEPPNVQLAILTAAVKIFLSIPESQPMLETVLKYATKKTENPDLRDRGYIYWRLLMHDKDLATRVIRGRKPPITAQKQLLPKDVLTDLIPYLGTLASVFHKVPPALTLIVKNAQNPEAASEMTAGAAEQQHQQDMNAQMQMGQAGFDSGIANEILAAQQHAQAVAAASGVNNANQQAVGGIKPSEAIEANVEVDDDLIDLGDFGLSATSGAPGAAPGAAPSAPAAAPGEMDLSILMEATGAAPAQTGGAPATAAAPVASAAPAPAGAPSAAATPSVLTVTTPLRPATLPSLLKHPSGVSITGDFILNQGKMALALIVNNGSAQPLGQAELQFNLNSFGIKPGNCELGPYPINPGETRNALVPLSLSPDLLSNKTNPQAPVNPQVQMGIRFGGGEVMVFAPDARFYTLLQPNGVSEEATQSALQQLYNQQQPVETAEAEGSNMQNPDRAIEILEQHGAVITNRASVQGGRVFQVYGITQGIGADFAAELFFAEANGGPQSVKVMVRGKPQNFARMVADQIVYVCKV